VLAVLVLDACGRQVGDEEEVELIEHRIEPCKKWCDLETDPNCGMGPTPGYEDYDGCVEECATVDGTRSAGWGYQADTQQDACTPEWQAHYQCVDALTCTDRRFYFHGNDGDFPPQDERPCWNEWRAMWNCESEK
jgi:hypothetical protein